MVVQVLLDAFPSEQEAEARKLAAAAQVKAPTESQPGATPATDEVCGMHTSRSLHTLVVSLPQTTRGALICFSMHGILLTGL